MPTSSNQSVPDARGYGWRTIHRRRRSSRQSSSSLTPTRIPTVHRSRSCESYKNKNNNNELTPDLAYHSFTVNMIPCGSLTSSITSVPVKVIELNSVLCAHFFVIFCHVRNKCGHTSHAKNMLPWIVC